MGGTIRNSIDAVRTIFRFAPLSMAVFRLT